MKTEGIEVKRCQNVWHCEWFYRETTSEQFTDVRRWALAGSRFFVLSIVKAWWQARKQAARERAKPGSRKANGWVGSVIVFALLVPSVASAHPHIQPGQPAPFMSRFFHPFFEGRMRYAIRINDLQRQLDEQAQRQPQARPPQPQGQWKWHEYQQPSPQQRSPQQK